MLRSIVEIARSQGEDFLNPESSLACLEVFALETRRSPSKLRKTAPTTLPGRRGRRGGRSRVLRYAEGNGERKRAGAVVLYGQDRFKIWS